MLTIRMTSGYMRLARNSLPHDLACASSTDRAPDDTCTPSLDQQATLSGWSQALQNLHQALLARGMLQRLSRLPLQHSA